MWWITTGRIHYSDGIMSAIVSQITSLNIVYSTVYPGTDQRKHQSSASLAFVREIHRWPVNSLHKGPITRKIFPFDDVIIFIIKTLFIFYSCAWRRDYVCPINYWFIISGVTKTAAIESRGVWYFLLARRHTRNFSLVQQRNKWVCLAQHLVENWCKNILYYEYAQYNDSIFTIYALWHNNLMVLYILSLLYGTSSKRGHPIRWRHIVTSGITLQACVCAKAPSSKQKRKTTKLRISGHFVRGIYHCHYMV